MYQELISALMNIEGLNTSILYKDNIYIPVKATDKYSCIDCCLYDICKAPNIEYIKPCNPWINKSGISMIFKKVNVDMSVFDDKIGTYILKRI